MMLDVCARFRHRVRWFAKSPIFTRAVMLLALGAGVFASGCSPQLIGVVKISKKTSETTSSSSLAPVISWDAGSEDRFFPSADSVAGRLSPVAAGQSLIFSAQAVSPLGASGPTIQFDQCVFESVGLDPAALGYVAPATSCASVGSLVATAGVYQLNTAQWSKVDGTTATASFSWTPPHSWEGTYALSIRATDGTRTSTASRTLVVRSETALASAGGVNVDVDLDAAFSASSSAIGLGFAARPRADSTADDVIASWINLARAPLAFTPTGVGAAPWAGSTRDYALRFQGAGRLSMGSVLDAKPYQWVGAWIRTKDRSLSSTILSTGGGAGTGWILRQSSAVPGTVEWVVGADGSAPTYESVVTTLAPSARWKLDESSGVVAADTGTGVCGGPCTGSYENTPILGATGPSGMAGTAIDFTGADAHVLVPDHAGLNANQISVAFWFRTDWVWDAPGSPSADTYLTLMSRHGMSAEGGFGFFLHGRAFQLELKNPVDFQPVHGTAADGIDVADNQWHHAVVNLSQTVGQPIEIYIDGLKIVSESLQGAWSFGNYPLRFGKSPNAWYADPRVQMDDVLYFKRHLTEVEVADLYTANNPCRVAWNTDEWTQIALQLASGAPTLFVNGKARCVSRASGSRLSSANLTVGANADGTSAWDGEVSQLVTVSDPAVSTMIPSASETLDAFVRGINRYAPSLGAIRSVVAEWLSAMPARLLALDANTARGLSPESSGCGSGTWMDSAFAFFAPAKLLGFAACGAGSGWVGSGVPMDPYRLVFDGVNDGLRISPRRFSGDPESYAFWLRSAGNWATDNASADDCAGLISFTSDASGNGGSTVCLGPPSAPGVAMESKNGSGTHVVSFSTSQPIADGVWHHLVIIRTHAAAGVNEIYIDGTLRATTTTASTFEDNGGVWTVGDVTVNWFEEYLGDIASIQAFDGALSAAQVKQLCHSEAARYSGATCAAP